MPLLSKYNSSSADILEEIEKASENPTVVSRQFSHFVQAETGLTMVDPEWCLAPLAPFLDEMSFTGDFGTTYDHLPDKMSFEIYGTHELWPLLLKMNGATGRHNFRGPKLRYVRSEYAPRLLEMLRFGLARAERIDASKPVVGDLTVREVLV